MRTTAAVACLLVACVTSAAAVEFYTCDSPRSQHARAPDFSVTACSAKATRCRLKKRNDVNLELKFTAEEDIPKLTNRVYAKLLGIPFPFIGVDGTSACESIFNADGSKAACPLKKGQNYIYKNTFKVLDIYPKVQMDVHWELVYDKDKAAFCFEVPARIVS